MNFYKVNLYKATQKQVKYIDNVIVIVGIGTVFGKVNEISTGELIKLVSDPKLLTENDNFLFVKKEDINENNKANYNEINEYADNFENSSFQNYLTQEQQNKELENKTTKIKQKNK